MIENPDGRTCDTCACWKQSGTMNIGQCKLNPPVPVDEASFSGAAGGAFGPSQALPVTANDDYCFQWR